MLNYPKTLIDTPGRYRHLYASLEAIRLKHNEWDIHHRPKDCLSDEARAHRKRCTDLQTVLLQDVLKLRPLVATPGWTAKDAGDFDPALATAKDDGIAAFASVDVKAFTGVDLDAPLEPLSAPPDPLENFTTYTEFESAGDPYSVAANTITVSSLTRSVDAWVVKDAGADHFGATFEHLFQFSATSVAAYGSMGCWAVSNVVKDMRYWYDNASESYGVRVYDSEDQMWIVLDGNEAKTMDLWAGPTYGTTYYFSVERTGETAIQCRIYTDAARTSLSHTLAQSIVSGRRYRYVFAANSYNSGQATRIMSGTIANLDLQEAAAGVLPGAFIHAPWPGGYHDEGVWR